MCRLKSTLFVLLFVFFVSPPVFALNLYSDSISTDSQINGTGWWGGSPYDPTSVTWEITDMGSYFHYKYIFDHPEHDTSYFIIEVSDNFVENDITTDLIYEITTYSDDGTNYQGMPGSVYGIKFESFTSYTDHGDQTVTETIEFDSTRAPTWGDFYARCGHHPSEPGGHGDWDAAWNVGFLASENTPNYDLDDGNHIAVPDTVTTLIELSYLKAIPASGTVTLEWKTESEIDNAGFNIYRSEDGKEFIKITDSLIPAQGSPTEGAQYEFTDDDVQNRLTYWYKLEDIDLNGTSTLHGPVSATPRLIYLLGK